mgnify:CR=1 FL=1|jgi:hypothetical protein
MLAVPSVAMADAPDGSIVLNPGKAYVSKDDALAAGDNLIGWVRPRSRRTASSSRARRRAIRTGSTRRATAPRRCRPSSPSPAGEARSNSPQDSKRFAERAVPVADVVDDIARGELRDAINPLGRPGDIEQVFVEAKRRRCSSLPSPGGGPTRRSTRRFAATWSHRHTGTRPG